MEHQTKPQSSQNENENENEEEGEARKNFTNANLTEVVATDSEQDELITVEETVVEYDVYEVIEEVTIDDDDDDDGDDYVEESYYSEDDYETVLNDTSSHLGNSIWKRNSSDGTNIWRRKVVASDDESADSFELRVPDLTEHMSDISFDDYNFGSPKTWSSKRSGDYSSPLSRSGSVDSLIQQQELYKDDSVDSLIIMSSSRSNDNSSSLRGRNNSSSSSSKGRKISSRRQKNAMPENPLHGIEEGEFESSRTLQVQISNDDDDNNSENNNDHQQATVEKTPSQSTKTITSTTEKEDEDGDEETRLKKWWNKPSRKKLSKKMVLKKKNKNANVKG